MRNQAPTSDRIELACHLVAFAIAAIVLALLSDGAYNDDDLDHYFIAAASLRTPSLLVDYWGRAGFTALYALPAQLGWNGARLFTLALVIVTGLVTARTAARVGARHPAVWAALAVWQPMVLLLSFSVLTEPLAALLVAIILNRQVEDRPLGAALAAGLLPTVRLELGILTLLVGAWLVIRHRHRWPLVLLLPVPFLVWGFAGGAIHGSPLWLLHEIRTAVRPLVTAGPIHYLRNLIVVTGSVGFLGLVLGAWNLATGGSPRLRFGGLLWVAGFTLLTLLTWDKLKFGASVGFLRHLIVLAPAGALLAGVGFERVVFDANGRQRAVLTGLIVAVMALVGLALSHRLEFDFLVVPGRDWRRLLTLLPAALVLLGALWLRTGPRTALSALPVAAALACLLVTRPIDLNVEQRVVQRSLDTLQSDGLMTRPLYVSHPWFYLFSGRDRWDRNRTPYTTRAALSAAPVGSVAVWENHYGWRLFGDVNVMELRQNPDWRLLHEFAGEDTRFRVIVFERMQGGRDGTDRP